MPYSTRSGEPRKGEKGSPRFSPAEPGPRQTPHPEGVPHTARRVATAFRGTGSHQPCLWNGPCHPVRDLCHSDLTQTPHPGQWLATLFLMFGEARGHTPLALRIDLSSFPGETLPKAQELFRAPEAAPPTGPWEPSRDSPNVRGGGETEAQSWGGTEAPARCSGTISPRHTFQRASVEAASDLSRALGRVWMPTPSRVPDP